MPIVKSQASGCKIAELNQLPKMLSHLNCLKNTFKLFLIHYSALIRFLTSFFSQRIPFLAISFPTPSTFRRCSCMGQKSKKFPLLYPPLTQLHAASQSVQQPARCSSYSPSLAASHRTLHARTRQHPVNQYNQSSISFLPYPYSNNCQYR